MGRVTGDILSELTKRYGFAKLRRDIAEKRYLKSPSSLLCRVEFLISASAVELLYEATTQALLIHSEQDRITPEVKH